MKAIARTRNGLEEYAAKRLKGKVLQSGVVEFETTQIKKIQSSPFYLMYVYELIETTKPKNILSSIKKIDFSSIKEPFRVICRKEKGGEFSSMDIEQAVGEYLFTKYQKKVDLVSPATIVLIEIVGTQAYIGLTDNTEKLSKREYRIKTNSNSLPGDIANALLEIAEWKPSELLIDPFCQTGEILIEAAIEGGKKLFGYDSNSYNIKKSKFNAKVAEVKIEFSQKELDWLDTEFKKDSVDHIISSLPIPSRYEKESEIIKKYSELFHQAEYILKKNAKITILTIKPNLLENINSLLSEVREVKITSGSKVYTIITFKK